MPAEPPARRTRADLAVAGLLLVAAAAIGAVLRLRLHPDVPVGEDLDIWGFSVLNLASWERSKLLPAYPLLSAGILRLGAGSHLWAATWASALCGALVPSGSWLLARRLRAPPVAAGIAAVAVLLTPQLLFGSQHVTPDSLTALSLLLLAFAVLRQVVRPGTLSLALLLSATAWLLLAREHGLVAVGLVAALLLWLPGSIGLRLRRLGYLALAVQLAPVLGVETPRWPDDTAWWGRIGVLLGDALSSTPSWQHVADVEGFHGSLPGLVLRALLRAPVAWAWVAAGLAVSVGLRREERAIAWAAVLPGAPALLLFSQPRHVLVVVPVAAALAAAGARRFPGRGRSAWLGGMAALLCAAPLLDGRKEWSRAAWLRGESEKLVALCARIEREGGPGGVWTGEARPFAFCPRPNYLLEAEPTSAIWLAIRATQEAVDPPWLALPIQDERYVLSMVGWHGGPRPCSTSRPAPKSPWFNVRGESIVLDPPCDFAPPQELFDAWEQAAGR